MSTPLRERLRELEVETRLVKVLPAAAVRAKGRRRAWRQRATVLAGVVVVAVAGGFAVTHAGRQSPVATPADRGLACSIRLPDAPAQVKVRVLGSGPTDTEKVVTGLRNRQFNVSTGPTAETKAGQGQVILRYGPSSIGDEALLRAYFPVTVTNDFDSGFQGDVIEVTVGSKFTSFRTMTQVNEFLVQQGEPTAPAMCTSVN